MLRVLICDVGVSSQLGLHQQCIYYEADHEGPYVVDRVDECPEGSLYSEVCKERKMNARTHAMIAAMLKPPEYQYLPSAPLNREAMSALLCLTTK